MDIVKKPVWHVSTQAGCLGVGFFMCMLFGENLDVLAVVLLHRDTLGIEVAQVDVVGFVGARSLGYGLLYAAG